MQVPDAIEPAVGYRVWFVKDNLLYSYNHGSMWPPEQAFVATCERSEHEVPDPKCSCGSYAAATFNRLYDMGYTKESGLFAAVHPSDVLICGEVSLWGNIIPGQHGWRAQFAYPKRLLIPYSLHRYARPLAERYVVPYKLFNVQRKH